VIWFRQCDSRFPFLWEGAGQPPARWHGDGEGPVHYLTDTPDGAWAEFLRHEEIRDPQDLETVTRAIWAVEVPDDPVGVPHLPRAVLFGGPDRYDACRREARRFRERGASGLQALSAALLPGEARGSRVDGGVRPGPDRDGRTLALFGPRPDLVGWPATVSGRPGADILRKVRYF